MPSSFDPLGLVKAMGPQQNPYEWAQLYAQDASRHTLQQEQLKAQMLAQEMQRSERAKESALDRASREGMHERGQKGADRRTLLRYTVPRAGAASKDWLDPPEGTMTQEEFQFEKVTRRLKNPQDYALVVKNGKNYRVPKSGLAKLPKSATIATTPVPERAAAPDPYDIDEVDDND